MKIAAYDLYITCFIGSGIAFLTGKATNESVENLAGIFGATIKMGKYSVIRLSSCHSKI